MEVGCKEEGVALDMVDMRDTKNLVAAIKPTTKLVWIETPTNPTLKILDVRAIAKICHEKKLILVADNTFMSPYLQNPLELGADIVVHSCTKYIGGHSDIIMGAVITSNDDLYARLKKNASLLGCCPGPFDCFLASRGLKTLALRVERAEQTAMKIAELLTKQPKVEEVLFPGLPNHPGYALNKSQTRGFGAMISIKIKGDEKKTNIFYNHLSIFGKAVSLGGVESLATIPVMITHKSVPAATREKLGITANMVRLSIGVEDFEDLRDDLLRALEAI